MEYEVQAGDSLSKIAKKFGQDVKNWEPLYLLNRDIIGNDPNKIQAGMTLLIPEQWNEMILDEVAIKASDKSVAIKNVQSPAILKKLFYTGDKPSVKKIAIAGFLFYFLTRKKIF